MLGAVLLGFVLLSAATEAELDEFSLDDLEEMPAAKPGEMPAAESGETPAAESGEMPAAEPGDMPAAEPEERPAAEPEERPAAKPPAEPMAVSAAVPAALPATASSTAPASSAAPPAGSAAEPAAEPQNKKVEVREDRIKSVQRKDFLKRLRWEFTPQVTLSLNDAFYQKLGGGGAIAFHPVDSLGIEFMGAYVGTVQTDMVGFYQRANNALPLKSNLRYYMMGSFLWSPLYGKLSFITDDILHFDAYFLAGFGLGYTETGSKFATNFGFGLRYFVTSWLVFKIEVRDLFYTETFTTGHRSQFSDVQNHLMLTAGVSFFLPVDFEYEFQ